MPKTNATLTRQFAKAAAASELVPTCPTMSVSTKPINIWPTCPAIIGQARASVLASSAQKRRGSGIDRSPNQDFSLWQVFETSVTSRIQKLQEFRSSGDEYLVESTSSRVEIFIAWRPINQHPQSGKPPLHSA